MANRAVSILDPMNPEPTTPAAIAAEQAELAERQKKLADQLAAGKDAEFGKLTKSVAEFNRIFNESYMLQLEKAARKCSLCHQPGHRAKACPTKAQGGAE